MPKQDFLKTDITDDETEFGLYQDGKQILADYDVNASYGHSMLTMNMQTPVLTVRILPKV